jgi:hypothetical protein
MKKLLVFVLVLMLFSCAEVHPLQDTLITDDPYGYLGGLCHGIFLLPSFIGSLFDDCVVIYSMNNTGGWYDFGFLMGCGISSFAASR